MKFDFHYLVMKVKLHYLDQFHFTTLSVISVDYFFWSPVSLYHKIISMKVQEYSSFFFFSTQAVNYAFKNIYFPL